ncbi:MAG: hypothetical protein ACI9CB_002233, partial [Rhodothermales bacterium]
PPFIPALIAEATGGLSSLACLPLRICRPDEFFN